MVQAAVASRKTSGATDEEKDGIVEQQQPLEHENWTKILKDDTRKQRRQKLKHSFERNNVIMVSTHQVHRPCARSIESQKIN